MRALPLRGQWPALALADGLDEPDQGLFEGHLAGFNEDETSVRAGKECEPRIDSAASREKAEAALLTVKAFETELATRDDVADATKGYVTEGRYGVSHRRTRSSRRAHVRQGNTIIGSAWFRRSTSRS